MIYSVTFVEEGTNKSTNYNFKKFKAAEQFLESLKKIKSKGYYVLYFTIG